MILKKIAITFELFDIINYIRKIEFKEIKKMNLLVFNLLKTNDDFYDYLKLLSKDKKINIKKSKDKISLSYLYFFYLVFIFKGLSFWVEELELEENKNINGR